MNLRRPSTTRVFCAARRGQEVDVAVQKTCKFYARKSKSDDVCAAAYYEPNIGLQCALKGVAK